jgi:hypothetical protein
MNEKTGYNTIFTVDENLHAGWNYARWEEAPMSIQSIDTTDSMEPHQELVRSMRSLSQVLKPLTTKTLPILVLQASLVKIMAWAIARARPRERESLVLYLSPLQEDREEKKAPLLARQSPGEASF